MKSLFLDVIPMTKPEVKLQIDLIPSDVAPANIIEKIKMMNFSEWAMIAVAIFSVITIIFVISVIVKVLRNKV